MKKSMLVVMAIVCLSHCAKACDSISINRSLWEIIYVSSEELTGEGADNGAARYAIDGNLSTYWHSEWKERRPDYPHTLIIDLKDTIDISGISITTRPGTRNGRIKDFDLYISNDTTQWGIAELQSQMNYPSPHNETQQKAYLEFGAIKGRYIKIVANTSVEGDVYAMIAELELFHDTLCPATGQHNQNLIFDPIAKQYLHIGGVSLHATSNTPLPISYEVISGPATLCNDSICFTGQAGVVVVKAQQAGNELFYPVEQIITFEIVDLNTIIPEVSCKFTDAYPLEMNKLYPYLLIAEPTIAESDSLHIEQVSFILADTTIEASLINGSYQAWWRPKSYGHQTIDTRVTASNGQSSTKQIILNIVTNSSTREITTFNKAIIDFGSIGSQWYTGHYTLPQYVGCYKQVTAFLDVSCPDVPGGCDDWDRMGWVEIKAPNGEWIELFRYITPFGVACSHSIDVTDFASLLQGNVEIRMYIETWGTGGWQLDLHFEYLTGKSDYLYSYVTPLWHGTYNFGDPAHLQPVDTVYVDKHPGSERAILRLVSSGHGWGDNNSKNASEFYKAMHHITLNSTTQFEHQPWMICNPNPDGCTGQKGTWSYSRAGWCPGTIAQTDHYDLTPYLTTSPSTICYIFQESYVDNCHPNNPDCISGKTCPNCNDTYNPMYRIGGYLIYSSNQPIGDKQGEYVTPLNREKLSFSPYPNPADESLFFEVDCSFENGALLILDYTGKNWRTYFFDNEQQMGSSPIDVSTLPDGIYYLKLYTKSKHLAKKIIIKH